MNFLMVLLLLLSPARGAERPSAGDDPAAAAYRTAYALVLDGKWGEAKAGFEDLLKRFAKSRYAEEAQYWLCFSRDKLGEPPEDVYACYADFIDKYPNGTWAKQASANLIMLSFRKREIPGSGKEVPFTPMRTSKEEDARIASLFTLQASDSAAALREAVGLYDASQSESFRGKLVYVFGSFRTPEAARKLGQIMRTDPSPSIRSDALALLANTRVPAAYGYLRDIVVSDEPLGFRQKALQALAQARMGGTDTLFLRIALHEQDRGLAALAASGLARLGGSVATRTFRTLLEKGRYPEVREVGFYSLAGAARNALPLKALQGLAENDPDPVIRLSARKLARMSPDTLHLVQLIMDLYTTSGALQAGGIVWFFTYGFQEPGLSELLLWAVWGAPEERLAADALDGLSRMLKAGGGTVYAKAAVLARFTGVKKAALREISALKAPAAVAVIDSVLRSSPDAGVRLEAIQAMAVQENDSAAAALLETSRNDPDAGVRSAAVNALGGMRTPRAAEAVKELEGR